MMILSWNDKGVENALPALEELFGREEVCKRLPRLKEIHAHAESWWRKYIQRLSNSEIKYLLIAESPPWSEVGEPIQYVLDPDSRSRTLMRALRGAFSSVSGVAPDEALSEFARHGFLLVDSVPFSMEYTSAKRKSSAYQRLIDLTANAVHCALQSSNLRWSPDLRIAFSVKLNALATISALQRRVVLGGKSFELTESMIAVNGSNYPDAAELRKKYGF